VVAVGIAIILFTLNCLQFRDPEVKNHRISLWSRDKTLDIFDRCFQAWRTVSKIIKGQEEVFEEVVVVPLCGAK